MVARPFFRSRSEVEYWLRVGLKLDWYELMPRHLAHGRHDAFVQGTLADGVTHLKGYCGDDREHLFMQDLKVFCSHWQLSRATQSESLRQLIFGRLPPIKSGKRSEQYAVVPA
jgi:hypothetical protein